MLTALGLALSVLEALPAFLQAGSAIEQLVQGAVATLRVMIAQGRDPTVAEWDAIHAQIAALRLALEAPEDATGLGVAAAPDEPAPPAPAAKGK